jgi:hypothetical protein
MKCIPVRRHRGVHVVVRGEVATRTERVEAEKLVDRSVEVAHVIDVVLDEVADLLAERRGFVVHAVRRRNRRVLRASEVLREAGLLLVVSDDEGDLHI